MPNARLYFLITRTPLHIGCGDSLGDIDKPVLRGTVTGHPLVPGTEVKGCLKEPATEHWFSGGPEQRNDCAKSLFGREGPGGTGMLCPQDAELLLLPVACWAGGWAWATSPAVLHRLRRKAIGCGLPAAPPAVPQPAHTEQAVLASDKSLVSRFDGGKHLILSEAVLDAAVDPLATEWADWLVKHAWHGEDSAWCGLARQRLAIVHDEVFDWLAETAMDVRSHNKIGPDGVVADNHLWRQEYVPEDAVFAGVMAVQPVAGNPAGYTVGQALAVPTDCDLQLGGRASVGFGWASLRPVPLGGRA